MTSIIEMKGERNQIIKVGIDIHGVLDTNPFFIEMVRAMLLWNEGMGKKFEIHVITGSPLTREMADYLKGLWGEFPCRWWDHYFSIQTFLDEKHLSDAEKINDVNFYPEDLWNSVKGFYCEAQEIDIHFDDKNEYLKDFTTNNFLYTHIK